MQPVTPQDIYRHRHLQDLSGDPGHSKAVFVVSRANRKQGGYRSTAWWVDTAADGTSRARQLTASTSSASSLLVDPTGERMAFIAQRDPDQGSQVHVIRFDGGEALLRAQDELRDPDLS